MCRALAGKVTKRMLPTEAMKEIGIQVVRIPIIWCLFADALAVVAPWLVTSQLSEPSPCEHASATKVYDTALYYTMLCYIIL